MIETLECPVSTSDAACVNLKATFGDRHKVPNSNCPNLESWTVDAESSRSRDRSVIGAMPENHA
jgi:hypothetical protein